MTEATFNKALEIITSRAEYWNAKSTATQGKDENFSRMANDFAIAYSSAVNIFTAVLYDDVETLNQYTPYND